MRDIWAALRRDPGLALLLIALLAAAIIYMPTVDYGLVGYDDPWLVRDNVVVREASWANVHTILFDLDSPRRFVLTPEYLPVRDLSVMLDYAVWGERYGGFHATNVALYLAAIVLWFAALTRLGIDRRIVGAAILVWALQPTHAESIAWLSERKGVLGAAFAGAAVLGHARFRAGAGARYLAIAAVCAACAVWSKATAAFAIASIAPLELALPATRVSGRRAMAGIVVIGAVALAAFVPVLAMATRAQVVGTAAVTAAGRWTTALGAHGLYAELAVLARPNATGYAIDSDGPSALDVVVGGVALVAVVVAAVLPRSPPAVRAGAILWLCGWLPVSHVVLPLQMVVAADRYALLPTLGSSLAIGGAVMRIGSRPLRLAAVAAIAMASAARAIDARSTWQDDRTLWARAVESDPHDAAAWSHYAFAVDDPAAAMAIVDDGLAQVDAPRLWLRKALLLLAAGDGDAAMTWVTRAAEAGEPRAMADLAAMLLDRGDPRRALPWATRAVALSPDSAHAQRMLGRAALAVADVATARRAFVRAAELEPRNPANAAWLAQVPGP